MYGLQHAGGRLLLHQCEGWVADALLSRGVAASAGDGAAPVDAALLATVQAASAQMATMYPVSD